jgi:hypothetical protein
VTVFRSKFKVIRLRYCEMFPPVPLMQCIITLIMSCNQPYVIIINMNLYCCFHIICYRVFIPVHFSFSYVHYLISEQCYFATSYTRKKSVLYQQQG